MISALAGFKKVIRFTIFASPEAFQLYLLSSNHKSANITKIFKMFSHKTIHCKVRLFASSSHSQLTSNPPVFRSFLAKNISSTFPLLSQISIKVACVIAARFRPKYFTAQQQPQPQQQNNQNCSWVETK